MCHLMRLPNTFYVCQRQDRFTISTLTNLPEETMLNLHLNLTDTQGKKKEKKA